MLDTEILTNALGIGDQVPRCIAVEFAGRRRSSATTLVELHDAKARRIDTVIQGLFDPRARSAVKLPNGEPLGIPVRFEVDTMTLLRGQLPAGFMPLFASPAEVG